MNYWQVQWVAYLTLVRKEVRRFMRIWVQTITPPAVNAVLYMIIFGGLIGTRIREVDGFAYMDYLVPGIIMMGIITNSYGNVVSSFFGSKLQKYVEELLVSPVSNFTILAGYVTGGVARGVTVGLVVTAVSFLFTSLKPEYPVLMVLIAILTSIMFSLGGFINAVFAQTFDECSIVPNFVLTPLTYLGGIFYSISMLPPLAQKLSLFNPVLYMINGFRFSILGVSDIPLWQSFAVIGIFIAILFTVALTLLNRGTGIKA